MTETKMFKVVLEELWGLAPEKEMTDEELKQVVLNRCFGRHEQDIGMGKIRMVSVEEVEMKDESNSNEGNNDSSE